MIYSTILFWPLFFLVTIATTFSPSFLLNSFQSKGTCRAGRVLSNLLHTYSFFLFQFSLFRSVRSKRWRRKTNERGEERKEKCREKSFQRIERETKDGWDGILWKRKFFMLFFPLQTFFTSFSKTHLSLSFSISLSTFLIFPSFRSLYLTLVSSYILQGHHILRGSFIPEALFCENDQIRVDTEEKKRWGSSS